MAKVMRRLLPLLLCALPAFGADPPLPQKALRAEMNKDWQQALDGYYRATQITPEHADIWLRIADIHAVLNETDWALQALAEAARLRPDDAALQARLAREYGAANRPHKALEAIQRALHVEPANTDYLTQQAELANWLDDTALAQTSYRALLAASPDNPAALRGIARLQARAGKLDQAVLTYSDYTKKYPKDVDVLIPYAETHMYRGDFIAADRLLERYREHRGADDAYRQARANLNARSGRPSRALQELQPMLADNPADYEASLIRTLALNESRDKPAARESLDKLERLGPRRPETAGAALQVETPLRPYLGTSYDHYSDSDDIRINRWRLFGGVSPTAASHLSAGITQTRLGVDRGTGLEPRSGSSSARIDEAWVAGRYRFAPFFAAELGVGRADNDRDEDTGTWRLDLEFQPRDNLSANYRLNRDVVAVSPLAAAIFIPRDNHRWQVGWASGYRTRLDAELWYADYDDGNTLRQITLSSRWVTLRSTKHNLDLGFTAQSFTFDKNLNNGYYDPDEFNRLWGVAYYYHKISYEDGVGVVFGLGPERDPDLDENYELGWNIRIEGTLGVYSDWQLTAYAAAGGRLNDSRARSTAGTLDPFRAASGGIELIRRF